jgi:hypothetical protein
MSTVLYLRVPEALKETLADYAARRGLSQTRAAVELLEQGLQARVGERSRAELEARLERSQRELEATRISLRERELELQAGREREQLTADTYRALAARAQQELARCPGCRKPVRGSDLLVTGRCPHCGRAVTELLAPAPRAALNQNEYLALVGALGLLTGIALSASEERTRAS